MSSTRGGLVFYLNKLTSWSSSSVGGPLEPAK